MKEIRGYIISIFSVFIFFIVGTLMWYRLHINYESVQNTLDNLKEVYVIDDVNLGDVSKINDSNSYKLNSYRFVLTNNDSVSKKISIKLINNSSKLDNNYLRYIIKKDNGKYSSVRSLNMDGDIYFDDLKSNSKSVYEIKIWVSDNYQNEIDYYGNLVAVYL